MVREDKIMERPNNIEYRIVKWPAIGKEYDYWYSIDEVYYDEEGKVNLWESGVLLGSANLGKLINSIYYVRAALDKPILMVGSKGKPFLVEE